MANYYSNDERDGSYSYIYYPYYSYGYKADYYDAPGYVSSSYSLGTGEAAYGYISSSSDKDYYSLGYLNGGSYQYTVQASGAYWADNTSSGAYNTPDVNIYDAYGNLVKSGSGGSVTFRPGSAGSYYVAVSDSSASQYKLTLSESYSYNYYAPSVTSAYSVSLNENSAAGTSVHDVYASDYDGDSITYAIYSGNKDVDGDGNVAFSIRSSDGLITVNDAGDLNYEVQSSFNLSVSAYDGSKTGYGTVAVYLSDLKEGPTLSAYGSSVNENSGYNTYAAYVYASNYSGTDSYSITGGNVDVDGDGSLPFYIAKASYGYAYIYVNDAGDLNYESKSQFDLKVSATDYYGTTTAAVTVYLANVNEAPVLSGSTLYVNENSSDWTSVGTVSGSDPEGSTLNYSIMSGNTDVDGDGSLPFYMTSSGQIYVYDTGDLNYESRSSFALTVRATDSVYNSSTATTTIYLNDVKEGPTISAKSFSINENSSGWTYLGSVAASSYTGSVSYSITGGNTDVDGDGSLPFYLSGSSLYVYDAGDLNYESKSQFDLKVSATDYYGTTTVAATVYLANVNEAPVLSNSALYVNENSSDWTSVGTVSGSDPEGGALSYSITSGNTDVDGDGSLPFYLTSAGQIYVYDSGDLNYESRSSFALTVRATDSAYNSTTATTTIYLNDVREGPTLSASAYSINENSGYGTYVGYVSASSYSGTVTYSITGGNTDVDCDGSLPFYISKSSNGYAYLYVNDAGDLNYESQSQFDLKVSATDYYGTTTAAATVSLVNANDAPTGTVTISGTATQGQTLTADNTLADEDGMGSISYQWLADGVEISGATDSTFTLTQEQVGQAITVTASYTDGEGSAESVTSAATDEVENVNDAPTGTVTTSGMAIQGETLTVLNTLEDEDGMGSVSYQWLADGVEISGATDSTFTLTQEQVGQAITVTASYTDGEGSAESVTSAATDEVENVNDAPTGSVTIRGRATQGETLTVLNTLADEDGMGSISYQWLADGVEISGATDSTFTLTQEQVGQAITVTASYTDGEGSAESVTSAATDEVENVNDAPVGSVTISGTATQGETLTAEHTLTDKDGMGSVSYQWLADGVEISGATDSTFTLTQEQVGQAITVTASYTDGEGSAESVTSAVTDEVENVNDAPVGSVTISGTATQGETLTAEHALTDKDGMGSVSYQWYADDNVIEGATDSTFTLTQEQVGKVIAVTASYTDDAGTAEAVTSNATGAVANVNEAPTGTVTISGTATQGQTLTASNTLADEDGMGGISYQWYAGDNAIDGATDSTYTLTASDVGQAISVRAGYTDDQGTEESQTSASVTPIGLDPGLVFQDATGLVTTEAGGTDSFTVALRAEPRHDVTLTFTISDATEAVFSASGEATYSVTFTVADWATAQTVELRGLDDKPEDGDVAYTISTRVSSSDLRYDGMRSGSGLSIANLSAQTTDDDAPDEQYGDKGGVAIADLIQGGNGASDLYGLNGRDEMYGNNGDDRLYGGYGDDVLFGNADDDELEGDQGNDKLDGGTGNDGLNGGTGNDSLYGQAGNDNLLGADGKDSLLGGDGNDTLNGGIDADNMDGGNGADVYYIDNATDVVRDSGTDAAIDTVYIMSYLSGGITLGTGIDNGALNDLAGKGSLTGNTGNNALTGNASENVILGGEGTDTLSGGEGRDTLDGGVGSDILDGGVGTDSLTGGAGGDNLSGGLGDDVLYSGEGDDVVDAGDGADLIIGGDGAGNDKYNGGTGIDTVKYTSATASITVNLGTGAASGTNIGKDMLSSIEYLIGGKGSDSLTGSAVANKMEGDTGNDAIKGEAGNDTLIGGSGNDTLDGGTGADSLVGGDGSDNYTVDSSSDKVVEASASAGGVDLVLSSLSAYTLAANVEDGRIMATGAASLTGNILNNVIYAGVGNNRLLGGDGTDTLSYAYGVSGTGTMGVSVSLAVTAAQIAGGSGSDTISGFENLTGSNNNDSLTGSSGANVLTGGMGTDSLYGGAGDKVKDVFDFNASTESKTGSARDKIYHFVTKIDKLDLSGIDANTATAKAGDQVFAFSGTTAKANSVWYKVADVDGNTVTKDLVVYGDVNGNATADFEIGLVGVTAVVATDFVL